MTSQILRFIILLLCACLSGFSQLYVLFPYFVAGLYVRNSPFGVVHGKPLFMAYHCHRKPMLQRVFPTPYQISGASISQINVTDYGILPDTGKDLTDGVQRLIDKVGQEGGGNLFFPKGKYLFNLSGKGLFLQINYSHITIEGERHGDPLFYAMTYRVKSGAARIITALGFTVARVLKTKNVSPSVIIRTFLDKLSDIKRIGIPQREHDQFFPFTSIKGTQTTADLSLIRTPSITIVSADAPHEEPLGDGHQPIGEK